MRRRGRSTALRYPAVILTFLILASLALGDRDGATTQPGRPRSPATLPAIVEQPDEAPAFALDISKPFVIELGCGSGRDGLDVIRVGSSGDVVVDRFITDPLTEGRGV